MLYQRYGHTGTNNRRDFDHNGDFHPGADQFGRDERLNRKTKPDDTGDDGPFAIIRKAPTAQKERSKQRSVSGKDSSSSF